MVRFLTVRFISMHDYMQCIVYTESGMTNIYNKDSVCGRNAQGTVIIIIAVE